MSQWPIIAGPSFAPALATITTSRGTSVTANSTANVKGTTWTQIIASTAEQYQALIVCIKGAHAAVGRGIMDIGIGASTAEQILIPDLRWGQGSTVVRCIVHPYFVPIGVASGTRISARAAASVASYVSHVQVLGIPCGMQFDPAFTQVDHYGIVTSDSGATGADAGATANTEGAYAVLTSSTANPIKMFYVILSPANTGTPAAGGDALIDVSIGAASSEQIIAGDLPFSWPVDGSFAPIRFANYGPFYCDIPSATRLTARAMASGTDATGRVIDVSVLAFW